MDLSTTRGRQRQPDVVDLITVKRLGTAAAPLLRSVWITPHKRYDSIGSAPVHEPRARGERFGPGHFRLGRLNEAAGVCGGRGPYGYSIDWETSGTGSLRPMRVESALPC